MDLRIISPRLAVLASPIFLACAPSVPPQLSFTRHPAIARAAAPPMATLTLAYSTLLGDRTIAQSIAVDGAHAAYIAGVTGSTVFPTTPHAYQVAFGGAPGGEGLGDAFVSKLSPDGRRLIYSTFLGGNDGDEARGIAVDGTGAAYVTGITYSANFPTTPGAYRPKLKVGAGTIFVAKLSPDGRRLIYSTFLGNGEGEESAAIAVDKTGAAYVTGYTLSRAFPTTPGAYQVAFKGSGADPSTGENTFVAKLSPDGRHLDYATFLGGSGGNKGTAIAVDGAGSAYIAGVATSRDFPTTPDAYQRVYKGGYDAVNNPAGDAFVAELSPDGHRLVYSTLLGGTSDDAGTGIAVDPSGAIYATGSTFSRDFPVARGDYQARFEGTGQFSDFGHGANAFVVRFSPRHRLVYATYLGGRGGANADAIAVDGTGNAYVTGTAGAGFPTTRDAYQTVWKTSNTPGYSDDDAFVTELSADGRRLLYSTYLGGGANEGAGITVDDRDAVYAAGVTNSGYFPRTPGAYQTVYKDRTDAFVTKLRP